MVFNFNWKICYMFNLINCQILRIKYGIYLNIQYQMVGKNISELLDIYNVLSEVNGFMKYPWSLF